RCLSYIKTRDRGSSHGNVTCIIPDDCILPCSFRPTGTVVIHWYKQQIPVHSYYYNKDQFGLQNKHFSGRTGLFNSHIPDGNASLLLRRVKVQDKGRYKCYTSTRKGNQEIFINLEVKGQCNITALHLKHTIFLPHHYMFSLKPTNSVLMKILGNLSNYTYICSFIAADKTQVWTASRKNQEDITQEEGRALSVPCIAPQSLHNFSLIWTFTVASEPAVILRYETKTRHTFNLWEGQAELDQNLLLLGDGSLLLHKPDIEEHSGTYTCILSGLQSRHIVQTKVNITVASISEYQSVLLCRLQIVTDVRNISLKENVACLSYLEFVSDCIIKMYRKDSEVMVSVL
uniref:Ig-like domain-containing protein n=1 Tax=Gasterosteus aculeatus aculeatus TaxID=481459 RepID=A0AAQ4QP09_GASAC